MLIQPLNSNSKGNNSANGILTANRQKSYNILSNLGFKVEESAIKIEKRLLESSARQLEKLELKYGALSRCRLELFCAENHNNDLAFTQTSLSSRLLHLRLSMCPSHYADREKLITECLKARDEGRFMAFADEMAEVYPVTHEYGHILMNILISDRADWAQYEAAINNAIEIRNEEVQKILQKVMKEFTEKYYRDIYQEIAKSALEMKPDKWLGEYLSGYARGGGYSEKLAEIFANSQLDKPNVLGKAMKEWLEKEGITNVK